MTTQIEFRTISDCEKEEAYSIICQRTEWLHSKDIKQWTEPLPRHIFHKRQNRSRNFGLFYNGRLVIFLSLFKENLPYWKKEIGNTEVWWLSTLATAIEFSGKQLGQIAVKEAIDFLKGKGQRELYLDCGKGNGFLPEYYERLGFEIVAQKDIDFPKCGLAHMVLMKYNIRTG